MSDTEPTPASPPPLDESARALFGAARDLASAWGGRLSAWRSLLAADVALAGTALVHALVLLVAATILVGTAWALLTALAVWALHHAGIGWGWAIAAPLTVSIVLGGWAIRQGIRAIQLADLQASRQQLAQVLAEARQAASSVAANGSTDETTP
ncbi:MAG: hypothetical protein JSR26_02990 [Proteobacteria bacterium]|nr:hypothetical protein [Pseudomonadota bacterium]